MKLAKTFLYLLGLILAFLAGYKLNGMQKSKPLHVLYAGDEALLTTSAEDQVLALILADPYEDAQLAFLSKDFRKVSTPSELRGLNLSPDQVKILPFSSCVIRNFSQHQVNGIVANYVKTYNDCLAKLLSPTPAGATAAQKEDPSQQRAEIK